jgi:hypothetical protein
MKKVLFGMLVSGPGLPDRITLGITTSLRFGAVSMMVAMQ